jgi:hypothetical protein
MSEKIKYTTYLAGAIEHATDKQMKSWRDAISEKLNSPDLLIYNPIAQESTKVGKPSTEQVKYITGLKRSGNWALFFIEMWKIWFGAISQNTDLIQLLTNLRMRKYIDGNHRKEIQYWGDAEAVVRSDFIIVYMPKNVKTVGTIFEVVFAFLFRIPIYLILPDCQKTNANSTLLFGNQISNNGELLVFYTINECVNYIKDKFKLKIVEQKQGEEQEGDLENEKENGKGNE